MNTSTTDTLELGSPGNISEIFGNYIFFPRKGCTANEKKSFESGAKYLERQVNYLMHIKELMKVNSGTINTARLNNAFISLIDVLNSLAFIISKCIRASISDPFYQITGADSLNEYYASTNINITEYASIGVLNDMLKEMEFPLNIIAEINSLIGKYNDCVNNPRIVLPEK